ncbi:MAG: methanogenesis marker 17 protein [Thermoprotei archaeon]|nr:MAG: methanogenesis marker 17 protein [Thermoprotei archaeon]
MKVQIKIKGDERRLFETLVKDVMMDLGVSGAIESLKMALDPHRSMFAMSIKMKPISRIVKLSEVAEITKSHDGVSIRILDEKFSPDILKALQDSYGDLVSHVSRYEILIKGDIDREALEHIPICDYAEMMERSIMELMRRITPEGFRSIKVLRDKEKLLLIASEDPLTDEIESEAKSMVEDF